MERGGGALGLLGRVGCEQGPGTGLGLASARWVGRSPLGAAQAWPVSGWKGCLEGGCSAGVLASLGAD